MAKFQANISINGRALTVIVEAQCLSDAQKIIESQYNASSFENGKTNTIMYGIPKKISE
jgi:hypothetical protein